MIIEEIKTVLDSFELFQGFRDDEYSFFLDSGIDADGLGQYSFMGADPLLIFKSKNDEIEISKKGKTSTKKGDPFAELNQLMGKYQLKYDTEFPFIGGAVGYFGYDLCHHIERIPRTAVDDVKVPDCFMGFYDGILIVDHQTNKTWLAALGIEEDPQDLIDRLKIKVELAEKRSKEEMPQLTLNEELAFKGNFTKEGYMDALDAIHEYIRAGDIYQTNLTQRFQCELQLSPLELYGVLRKINPAPFASFLDFGEGQIVSSSPERFIKVVDRAIETRPIKGTMPRGKTPQEDAGNRKCLENSEKDKAELLMIVDLQRNDVGKICKSGTVKVPELYKLETYETVFHLVSTVVGQLKDDISPVDCVKATFPGGSITGAPKIRAMEIIDELEPTQRNIYTGSIGYLGFNGDLDLNIVIRTIVCKDGEGYFQVGGGIVWDSDNQLEYEETYHKGKALFEALKYKKG
ncbi:aminodeoxychorismate synthase component I [Eubacteriaceae bacterium ES3]|nr:aminodeoxychorismate synthase component I [Eubacteriaceae bacterium ES3]